MGVKIFNSGNPMVYSLSACFFASCCANDESLIVPFGRFFISIFDIAFAVFLISILMYALMANRIRIAKTSSSTLIFFIVSIVVVLLNILLSQQDFGDKLRDARVIFYYLVPPFAFLILRQRVADMVIFHKSIVFTGVIVSIIMYYSAFTSTDPGLGRNIRVAIWELPIAISALIVFKDQYRISTLKRLLIICFFCGAIIVSQNRSQYIQLVISLIIIFILFRKKQVSVEIVKMVVPTLFLVMVSLLIFGKLDVLLDRMVSFSDLEGDSSMVNRLAETEGQINFFFKEPIFGHGIGFRSLVMGPEGFSLSTFAHNSWLFYLMKFGLFWTPFVLAAVFFTLYKGCVGVFARDEQIFRWSAFFLATVPTYFILDSFSAGLAYAPKSLFLTYFLSYAVINLFGIKGNERFIHSTKSC